MSRKEAMSRLRGVLLHRRESLLRTLATMSGLWNPLEGLEGAPSEKGEEDDTLTVGEVETRELASIVYALEQMRRGEYGQCEECGNSIALARLQAVPYAVRCWRRQAMFEKKEAASED